MSKNIVAHGNMKHEESTIHQSKDVRCGNILKVQVSRLEDSLGHRVYKCDGCDAKWKFGVNK
tara:strand:- start:1164 stop:1349 length:186 start_codon:yes stop_codon:yes gene_type:complete